jgi:hypothetical protein
MMAAAVLIGSITGLLGVGVGAWVKLVYLHSQDLDQQGRARDLLDRGGNDDDPP